MKLLPRDPELTWLTPGHRCGKTAFIQNVYYTFMSAFSRIVLTQRFGVLLADLIVLAHSRPERTYAITMKNKLVAGILSTVCAAQFGSGIYKTVWSILNPGQYFHYHIVTIEHQN